MSDQDAWPLPLGYVVRTTSSVRSKEGGRMLIGGSPTRVLYLSSQAAALVGDGTFTVTDERSANFADRLIDAGIANPVVAELPSIDVSRVTYIVPVHDRQSGLRRLLSSIPRPARVILVDDASRTPEASSRIAQEFGADFIGLKKNVGAAAARNAALAEVTTAFVAFIDSDVMLSPGAMQTMIRHFADPRVALVAPRVLGITAAGAQTWVSRYENARSSLDLGRRPSLVRPRSTVSWVSSTTMLARVDALAGGFDPHMRSGEDVDLVWRLHERGFRIRYEPAATVLHEHRSTVETWLSRKVFYGSSAAQLAQRHPDNIAPAVMAPWAVITVGAIACQRSWSLPIAIGATALTAHRIYRKLRPGTAAAQTSAVLAAQGVANAFGQVTGLLLRHWWPPVVVGMLASRRLRRAVLIAHLLDVSLELARTRAPLDPFRFGVARRLDDVAYGAGVWLSMLRARSLRAVTPDFRPQRHRRHRDGLKQSD